MYGLGKYFAFLLILILVACGTLQIRRMGFEQNAVYLQGQTAGGYQVKKLVPLPSNESSEFLATKTVDWVHFERNGELVAWFSIVIGPSVIYLLARILMCVLRTLQIPINPFLWLSPVVQN